MSSQHKRILGEKTFTEEDQRLFASASGDCNPMHVDPVAARRLLTGSPVVHGIHVLITALEYWQNENNALPLAISCSFSNPVNITEKVSFTQRRKGDHDFIIEAAISGLTCAQIVIETAPKQHRGRRGTAVGENRPAGSPLVIDRLSAPLDEAPEYHCGKSYLLTPIEANLSGQFPRLYGYLGEKRVAGILALSYFVGMVCPGLHSIFSRMAVSLGEDVEGDAGHITLRVDKYDERFRLFDVTVTGCIEGSISAFLRPPPKAQPTFGELAEHVRPDEFRGTRSLVIGGSRGLGELTAKLIAAGGGDVLITHASGANDAKRVRDEINTSGPGHCGVLKLDLLVNSFESMNVSIDSLDAVYFFVTPRIQRKKAAVFEPRIFLEFVEFYLTKFYELCVYLESRVAARNLKVYFPSSVFVSERPSGMAEYAMAKAAAEVLVQEVNRHCRKLSVTATRLPRLNTDQTSSLLRVPTESNIEALLPIVRSMIAR